MARHHGGVRLFRSTARAPLHPAIPASAPTDGIHQERARRLAARNADRDQSSTSKVMRDSSCPRLAPHTRPARSRRGASTPRHGALSPSSTIDAAQSEAHADPWRPEHRRRARHWRSAPAPHAGRPPRNSPGPRDDAPRIFRREPAMAGETRSGERRRFQIVRIPGESRSCPRGRRSLFVVVMAKTSGIRERRSALESGL
jgi:hypothetical protein